jgi:dTMP kinase
MLITFEGIDYSGKTTQANLLVERLKESGRDVLFLREPGGTPVSEKIRSILLDKQHLDLNSRAELLLFSAARSQLVRQVIVPALERRTVVVCDRFYDSTTAYQGYGRGIDLADIRVINKIATFGITPDRTFLVDVGLGEIARRRAASGLSADRMESEGKEFFERVRRGYLAIAAEEPARVSLLDGASTIEAIHDVIWNEVQQRFTPGRGI